MYRIFLVSEDSDVGIYTKRKDDHLRVASTGRFGGDGYDSGDLLMWTRSVCLFEDKETWSIWYLWCLWYLWYLWYLWCLWYLWYLWYLWCLWYHRLRPRSAFGNETSRKKGTDRENSS